MNRFIHIFIALLLLFPPFMAYASSHLATGVLSGGGGKSQSLSFVNTATIGQPTPLETQEEASWSENFRHMPGFWHTVDSAPQCSSPASMAAAFGSVAGESNYNLQCDFDVDGDVDGIDLLQTPLDVW